jgi:hypothetical protein
MVAKLFALLLLALPALAQYTPPSSGGGGGSVSLTGGTGISVAPNPITGTGVITNTAPGASPAGSLVGANQLLGAGSMFAADQANLYYVTSTTAPAAPVVTRVNCSNTSTTYGYKTAFNFFGRDSAASAETTVACNATLTSMTFPIITAPACTNSFETVDVFLSTGAGNVPDAGWIANVACGATFSHQGNDGDPNGGGVPSVDLTKGQYISNAAFGLSSIPFVGFFNSPTGQPALTVAANTYSGIAIYSNASNGSQSVLDFVNYRGTFALPTAVQDQDLVASIDVWAYDGLSWGNTPPILTAFVDGTPVPGVIVPTSVRLTAQDGNAAPESILSVLTLHKTSELSLEKDDFTTGPEVITIAGMIPTATGIEFNLGVPVAAAGTYANVNLGSIQQLANVVNPFISTKNTQAATAPGAGKADLRWLAGTNAGTCKLVSSAGTNETEVTIVDNVGGGC